MNVVSGAGVGATARRRKRSLRPGRTPDEDIGFDSDCQYLVWSTMSARFHSTSTLLSVDDREAAQIK